MWLCSSCGQNNEDSDLTCLLCGSPKPAETKADTVCTLTNKRATELCAYEDVTIPDEFNVIGENAFKGRKDLYTVNIHSGVKKIMKSAFEGCTNLCKVYYSGKLSYIGTRAFADCKHLSPEKRPSADRVAADAFVGCSATPIPDPERVVGERKTAARTKTSASPSTSTSFTKSKTSSTSAPKTTTAPKTSTATKPSAGGSSTATSFTKKAAPTTAPKKPSSPPPGYRPVSPTPPPYTPPKPTTPKPTPSPSPVGTGYVDTDSYYGMALILPVIITVALFIFCQWGKHTTWTEWSYMLSLTVTLMATSFAVILLQDTEFPPICWGTTAIVVLAALINLCFGRYCIEMTVILALTATVISALNAWYCFDECEEGYGWWSVIVTVLGAALTIYTMITHSPFITRELWQTIISVPLSILLAYATRYILDDKCCYEYGLGLQLVGLIATFIMMVCFGNATALSIMILSTAMTIAGIISTVGAFKDDEIGAGVMHILMSIGNLAILIVNQVFWG